MLIAAVDLRDWTTAGAALETASLALAARMSPREPLDSTDDSMLSVIAADEVSRIASLLPRANGRAHGAKQNTRDGRQRNSSE
jgi:hypothetical protein